MPNEVIELAYEEARAALREQDATLGGLRNRATGLLAATSVGVSFAAAVGFINTDPTKGSTFPAWAAWTLLPLILLAGGAVMAITWPGGWAFGPSAESILAAATYGIDEVRTATTTTMLASIAANEISLRWRMRLYQAAVLLLLIEAAALILTLVIGRR